MQMQVIFISDNKCENGGEMSMEQKKLYRSKENKMICGVCGGLAEYFNIDPTIVRLLTVVIALGSAGTVLLAYIIAAVIIPDCPDQI